MQAAFEQLMGLCAAYGYPVLFLGVLLENAGLPVPGETAVLVAGALASSEFGHRFHLTQVILVVIVAAIVGDNLGYWMGRTWARPRLEHGGRFLFLTPRALGTAEGYFHRYGSWTIFFARFVTGLRVVGALAAGTAAMPWQRFVVANAAGAVAWAVTISLLGYHFAENWRTLEKWIRGGGWIALGAVVTVFLTIRFRRRLLAPFAAPGKLPAAGDQRSPLTERQSASGPESRT